MIQFTSVQKVKDSTVIEQNVENNIIEPQLIKAQEIKIKDVLGSKLYESVELAISGGTVSGVTQTLLDDYIIPCLCEWTLYNTLPYITFKMENSSIVTKDTDSSTPIDLPTLKYLRNDVRETAEFLTNRIDEYLCANRDLYPTYKTETESDETKPDYKYFSGLSFSKRA